MDDKDIIQQLLENCKISVKLISGAGLKGRAKVDFGVFEVNGFMIRQNAEGKYWVNPPSFQSDKVKGRWGKVFYSPYLEEFWNPLTEKILAEHQRQAGAEYIEDFEEDDSLQKIAADIPY